MTQRQLILEDGTVFTGTAFGSSASRIGEVIFNTGMTGYQEVISDPNYYGNITVMTYPSIGAYGINRDDFESITPCIKGMVVKELNDEPSNFRSEETLHTFLREHDIPGIAGIDTRKLTRMIREKGSLKGIITDVHRPLEEALKELAVEQEATLLVEETSISKPYIVPGQGTRIVVIDLGMKHSILHELMKRNCHVTVVPYDHSPENIFRFKPDGVLISNGPGNPANVTQTIKTVKTLLGDIPLFSIGLGHQIFAIACGAKTKKMKVGHYGPNYAVKDIIHDQSWLTTQSRHYHVDETSLKNTNLQVTFRSLNDNTIEGLKHKKHPAFSVQFNPEGAPGSNETNFLFDDFLQMINEDVQKNGGNQYAKK